MKRAYGHSEWNGLEVGKRARSSVIPLNGLLCSGFRCGYSYEFPFKAFAVWIVRFI